MHDVPVVLQLLDLETGATVVQLYQKGMSKDAWPALQLSSDEELLAHMVNNTVNIYKTRAFAEGELTSRCTQLHSISLQLQTVANCGLTLLAMTYCGFTHSQVCSRCKKQEHRVSYIAVTCESFDFAVTGENAHDVAGCGNSQVR